MYKRERHRLHRGCYLPARNFKKLENEHKKRSVNEYAIEAICDNHRFKLKLCVSVGPETVRRVSVLGELRMLRSDA